MTYVLWLIILSLIPTTTWAQESYYYEISNAYLEEVNKFSCEIISETVKEFSKKSKDQINKEIEQELQEVRSSMAYEVDLIIKTDLELYAQFLEEIKKEKYSKKILVDTLESFCKVIKFPIQRIGRSVSLLNTVAFHTSLMPFSSVFNFSQGVFSKRDKDSLEGKNDTLYRISGPQNGVPLYLLSSIIWTVPNILINFNPVVLGLNASKIIEVVTNYACFNVNPTDYEKIGRAHV